MTFLKLCLTCALLVSLSACGFKPLYGNHSEVGRAQEHLETIAIDPINTKLGVMVRNNLLDRLTPGGAPDVPRYQLKLGLREQRIGVGVRLDASVTRFNYLLITNYNLIDQDTQKTVFASSSRSQVAYDVVRSQFATVIAEQDAIKRAARDVSEEITLRLALFFATGTFPSNSVDTQSDSAPGASETLEQYENTDMIRDTL